MPNTDFYISVDVETAGPYPARYSLLSIGACTILVPMETFYVELQPDREEATREALEISGLKLETLNERGLTPADAMSRFDRWLARVVPTGSRPVMVALNAPFDWMFLNDYFHRYLGKNPFGHSALDIKAYYMGLAGVPWSQTGMTELGHRYLDNKKLVHHALQDALDQAEIMKKLLQNDLQR